MHKRPRYGLTYVINNDDDGKGGGIKEGGPPLGGGYLDKGVLRDNSRSPFTLEN